MISYWIRWIINVVWALWSKPISIAEKTVRKSFVFLDQLDMNLHMNNAQFFTALEYSRTEFWIRAGLFAILQKKNLKTMLGGSSFQFRRQLHLFQTFETTCEVEQVDDRWVFIKQEFWSNGNFVGRGIARMAFVDGKTNKLVSAIPVIEELYGKKLDERFIKKSKLIDSFIEHDNELKEQ